MNDMGDEKAFQSAAAKGGAKKKPAETQFFHEDEARAIIELSYKPEEEKNDELYYAVSLFFCSFL